MKKFSLGFIAFLQAFGLTLYCLLIGTFFWQAGRILGPINSFLGPALMLLLLVISVIICALLFGYYPFILFWEKKDTKKAIKSVIYTTGWLFLFSILVGILLAIFP